MENDSEGRTVVPGSSGITEDVNEVRDKLIPRCEDCGLLGSGVALDLMAHQFPAPRSRAALICRILKVLLIEIPAVGLLQLQQLYIGTQHMIRILLGLDVYGYMGKYIGITNIWCCTLMMYTRCSECGRVYIRYISRLDNR